MPSSKNYKRDYAQERKTAKKRGETGVGSKSGDATRHRARRQKLATLKNKTSAKGKDVDHKRPIKSGGGNSTSNLRLSTKKANRSKGGKIGSRKGKAAGGRKGKRP
jgi:5-methylcytosine-specific restriction endonuclease McrA